MRERRSSSKCTTCLTWKANRRTRPLRTCQYGCYKGTTEVDSQLPSCMTPSTVIWLLSISGASLAATLRGTWPTCVPPMFFTCIALLEDICAQHKPHHRSLHQGNTYRSYLLCGSRTSTTSSPGPTKPTTTMSAKYRGSAVWGEHLCNTGRPRC